MGRFWPNNRLLTQALAASMTLHLLFALLIPRLTWSAAATNIETITFVKLMTIRVQTPRPRVREVPAAAPLRAAAPRIAPLTHARARVAKVQKPVREPKRVVRVVAAAPVTASSASPGGLSAVQAAAAGTPAAPVTAPPPEVATATRHGVGGYMPLGVEQPIPVLDPAVAAALRKLNVHVTLLVTVGPDGRTKSVDFNPPIDTSIETQIRTMLAAASWDPAVCGAGIACEGRATIRL
jgi:hypothetical protein